MTCQYIVEQSLCSASSHLRSLPNPRELSFPGRWMLWGIPRCLKNELTARPADGAVHQTIGRVQPHRDFFL